MSDTFLWFCAVTITSFGLKSLAFSPENFSQHEECSNFLTNLEFMGEVEISDHYTKDHYSIAGLCIIRKSYENRVLESIYTICPSTITKKTARLVDYYMTYSPPEIRFKEEELNPNDWHIYLPCKRYQRYVVK